MVYLFLVEAETFGAGKTTVAANAAMQLQKQGFHVGGVLSLPVYEYDGKGFTLIGQDALLLPSRERLELARVGRTDWEPRNTFPDQERSHPRLTERRRHMNVDPRAASKCLTHFAAVLQDPGIDAVVFDEVGTILGGQSTRQRDPKLYECCLALAGANKQAAVVTVQLRGQHRQDIVACVEAIKRIRRMEFSDYLVLDGLLSKSNLLPPTLLALHPRR